MTNKEETRHEETDENGNTYTVTYTYVDRTNDHSVDASFYKWTILFVVVFSLMAAYFWYREIEVQKLKDRCSVPVSALVVKIRKSKHGDRMLRSKYMQYNATYRYTYNGNVFESQNEYYGSKVTQLNPFSTYCGESEGEMVTVQIDSADPNSVYDLFAEQARKSFFFYAAFLIDSIKG